MGTSLLNIFPRTAIDFDNKFWDLMNLDKPEKRKWVEEKIQSYEHNGLAKKRRKLGEEEFTTYDIRKLMHLQRQLSCRRSVES